MASVSLSEELGRRVATAAQGTAHELVRTASFRWSPSTPVRLDGHPELAMFTFGHRDPADA